jgi:hypothetical protein|tara:strand:- start:779 stop:988 length:210 start_codon:yes stop_codon:yes gene_type:complete
MSINLSTIVTSCALGVAAWGVLLLVDLDKKIAVFDVTLKETRSKVDENHNLIKLVFEEVTKKTLARNEN